MNLYEVHENAAGNLDREDVTCLLLWAPTESEAIGLYQSLYLNVTEASRPPDVSELVVRRIDPLPPEAVPPAEPGLEADPRVQRRLGWRIELERICYTCGLAAMDLPEFRVCPECWQCPECEHIDDCERREDD
jgi:hypothetical protein